MVTEKAESLIATIGIALLTYELGSLPIVSMILAVTFSLYGAIKKPTHLIHFRVLRLKRGC